MTGKWLEIRLAVPDEAVEMVAHMLVEIGCTGVTSAEVELDTFVAPLPESLANDPVIKAYFSYPDKLDKLLEKVSNKLSELAVIYPELAGAQLEFSELADHDWASDWQQHFPPFRVGDRLVIHPSWTDWQAAGDEVVLTLDPGQAFGTGTHATTSLCLDALAGHFAGVQPPNKILDVGTGSGILAMAGAALGAGQVVAIDIDKDACRIARDNISHNRLDHIVAVANAELEEVSGTYDLVLANILAGENLRLADQLVARLTPGAGQLVLSGILIEQEQTVIKGFASYPLDLLATNHRDEWTCIVYQSHE
jgi:ribosomal protein L11 methyltransferase